MPQRRDVTAQLILSSAKSRRAPGPTGPRLIDGHFQTSSRYLHASFVLIPPGLYKIGFGLRPVPPRRLRISLRMLICIVFTDLFSEFESSLHFLLYRFYWIRLIVMQYMFLCGVLGRVLAFKMCCVSLYSVTRILKTFCRTTVRHQE